MFFKRRPTYLVSNIVLWYIMSLAAYKWPFWCWYQLCMVDLTKIYQCMVCHHKLVVRFGLIWLLFMLFTSVKHEVVKVNAGSCTQVMIQAMQFMYTCSKQCTWSLRCSNHNIHKHSLPVIILLFLCPPLIYFLTIFNRLGYLVWVLSICFSVCQSVCSSACNHLVSNFWSVQGAVFLFNKHISCVNTLRKQLC